MVQVYQEEAINGSYDKAIFPCFGTCNLRWEVQEGGLVLEGLHLLGCRVQGQGWSLKALLQQTIF
jgi:hypothetical protein